MLRSARLGADSSGAVRVGPVIGVALGGAGQVPTGITAGSDPDLVEALLQGLPQLTADEVVRRSELFVIAMGLEQLAGLIARLAEVGAVQPDQSMLHIDPRQGVGILAPAVVEGMIPLAIHPTIAFTGTSMDRRSRSVSVGRGDRHGEVPAVDRGSGCQPANECGRARARPVPVGARALHGRPGARRGRGGWSGFPTVVTA